MPPFQPQTPPQESYAPYSPERTAFDKPTLWLVIGGAALLVVIAVAVFFGGRKAGNPKLALVATTLNQMKLNDTQFEKLAGYFTDLAKVWFASGAIGFFISVPEQRMPLYILISSIAASFFFLLLGILLLQDTKA